MKCKKCLGEVSWLDSYGSLFEAICEECNDFERLEEIRMELTEIYMRLGNSEFVSADSQLNEDISILKKDYAKGDKSE